MQQYKHHYPFRISLIAAIAANRVIGKDNKLLWHLPEDLRRFRRLTSGHPVIMGRKTFESIGKPLPKRTNIVITSQSNYEQEGIIAVSNLDQALDYTHGNTQMCINDHNKEIFIIGGGRVYAESIDRADRLYLTVLDQEFEGDTIFPDWREQFNQVISEEEFVSDTLSGKYLILERS